MFDQETSSEKKNERKERKERERTFIDYVNITQS